MHSSEVTVFLGIMKRTKVFLFGKMILIVNPDFIFVKKRKSLSATFVAKNSIEMTIFLSIMNHIKVILVDKMI
jgi:hypothetical protein